MFIHSVYFWLRPDLTADEQAHFATELRSLQSVPSIRHSWVGAPGPTERSVVDRTYDHAIVFVFDDMAGHDAYQAHEAHTDFLVECESMWARLQVYDIATD